MPVILSEDFIKEEVLQEENIFAINPMRASSQDIRPLKIAIVNLMPNKEETEIDLLKLISAHALQIEVDFIRTTTYENKHADLNRLNKLYKSYDDIKDTKYDGMIITGAPIENIDYKDIKYWDELTKIFIMPEKMSILLFLSAGLLLLPLITFMMSIASLLMKNYVEFILLLKAAIQGFLMALMTYTMFPILDIKELTLKIWTTLMT